MLATIGESLRSARQSRQLSLDDIRGTLGIPLHYLEAMEGRESGLIADQFYLVPFLRRYADYLELDGATVVARFLDESVRSEAAAASTATARAERRASRRWLLWVGATVGAAAIAWAAWRFAA